MELAMQIVSERDLDVASPAVDVPATAELTLVVAATYTAEPMEGPLLFWLDELGFHGRVEFAPYNQILQQLLDPNSELGRNTQGINLVLVRLEDLARFKPEGWDEAVIRAGAEELGSALRAFAERSGTPTLIVLPPASPSVAADPSRSGFLAELEGRFQAEILAFDSLHWLGREETALYSVEGYFDEAGDRVGHIPYTALATAGLATAIARRIHAIKSPPYKVVALDCDNTLWRGVVGEDGPLGVTLGSGMKALQEFVVAQQAAGMVVCLVSKNVEADVLEAFDVRQDFPLRRDHLVSWRISWEPKSRALAELAEELNLGLDSFIFLDDNPVECAEVRSALPQVLTIQAPPDEGFVDLLRHSWAFDRLKVTEEDRKRTMMYRLNADRTRLESQAADIGAFLASLELKIDIGTPSEDQWARVAQLTQRTNQFNFSTRRRAETEVRQLDRSGLECLRVEVSDRFGEYGLVGVVIFGSEGDALSVDTMLLSCRVLGRGVEHAMYAHLGKLALERGLAFVEARFIPSPKNEPALKFLDSLAGVAATSLPDGQGTLYRLTASAAVELDYRPGDDARDQLELARTGGKKKASGPAKVKGRDKSVSYARIAGELARPEAVLKAVEAASMTGRSLETPFILPNTAMERQLVDVWCKVLHVDRVGIRDAFNDLGGTSLKAARLFVEVESQFGIRLPMTTLLDAPTVEQLAARIAAAGRGEARKLLRLLKPGIEGGPALFLVHDGDGEILLYLNLARRMPAEVAVYGLEPHGNDRCPTILTSIPDMAAWYVNRVREACPSGPYLLGGMCAGGTIAFEMAMQLQASGQTVGLVALLDAADANAELRPNLLAGRRWESFVKSLRGGGSSEVSSAPTGEAASRGPAPQQNSKLGRLAKKAVRVGAKVRNVAAYEVGSRLKKRADAAMVRSLRDAVERGVEPPNGFVGPKFRTVYNFAEREFHPSGQLNAPVLLFRAGGDGLEHPGDEPLARIYNEPLLGWAVRVAEGPDSIEVVDVPGGHGGMLQEPHVATIAGPLRIAIDRASVAEVR
jgi:FkbH-like protein